MIRNINENTNIEVSILLLIYNASLEQILKTIKSIIQQKNCSIELIISDDCSISDYTKEIDEFLHDKYNNYIINRNDKNLGTVENIRGAISLCRGDYIYLISPDDYIFDTDTISHFYKYSLLHNLKICTGNILAYQKENSGSEPTIIIPYYKNLLENSKFTLRAFVVQGGFIGCSYFREKKSWEKYLNEISGKCRFVEDNTTTLLAILGDVRIGYLNEVIACYECTQGVSNSELLKHTLESDYINFYSMLKKDILTITVLILLISIVKVNIQMQSREL